MFFLTYGAGVYYFPYMYSTQQPELDILSMHPSWILQEKGGSADTLFN